MTTCARRDAWRRASAVDRLDLLFLGLVVVFAALAVARLPHPIAAVAVYAGLLFLVTATGWWRATGLAPPWKRLGLFVQPILFMFCMFESFALVMPYFVTTRYDAALARLDRAVLGVDPTVWIAGFATPWLTDALYLLYGLYYPLPFVVLVPLFRRGELARLERAMFHFLVCYFGAYVLCFFVPAEGPRFHLAAAHAAPLEGVLLTAPIRDLIDLFEPNKLDAFPSLHASILAMTLLLAWREVRHAFWIAVPLAAGITVSLVYCRYHYVADVVAGFVWTAIADRMAVRLWPVLAAGAPPHFGADETAPAQSCMSKK